MLNRKGAKTPRFNVIFAFLRAFAPLRFLLVAAFSSAHAADTLYLYNWNNYISPATVERLRGQVLPFAFSTSQAPTIRLTLATDRPISLAIALMVYLPSVCAKAIASFRERVAK